MTGLLLLAAALGGLIGWERERHDHPAGLRTHILVCVGAALITLVDKNSPGVGGRIAAQIVTGVGFLGAGTIIRAGQGLAVRGLTTAASVWAIAGVGIAVGYGGLSAQVAAVATLIILFTLTTVNHFEDALLRRRRRQKLSVIFAAACDPLANVQRILEMLKAREIKARDFQMQKMGDSEVARFWLHLPHEVSRDTVDQLLSGNKDIVHYDWDE
ncbi:MAG: MgtC/SapB family protein [Armatimonadetes bacterium]|nr:MgtC/SapB family protein [Armatimonadota bacterium]